MKEQLNNLFVNHLLLCYPKLENLIISAQKAGNIDNFYYDKYLKYKTKYHELKYKNND